VSATIFLVPHSYTSPQYFWCHIATLHHNISGATQIHFTTIFLVPHSYTSPQYFWCHTDTLHHNISGATQLHFTTIFLVPHSYTSHYITYGDESAEKLHAGNSNYRSWSFSICCLQKVNKIIP